MEPHTREYQMLQQDKQTAENNMFLQWARRETGTETETPVEEPKTAPTTQTLQRLHMILWKTLVAVLLFPDRLVTMTYS